MAYFLKGVERLHECSYISDMELKDDTFHCHGEQWMIRKFARKTVSSFLDISLDSFRDM